MYTIRIYLVLFTTILLTYTLHDLREIVALSSENLTLPVVTYETRPFIVLSGSNYIDLANNSSLQLTNFSISVWFSTTMDAGPNGAFIVNKGGIGSDSPGSNLNYGIWMTNLEQIQGGFETPSGIHYNITSPNKYNDGKWHHSVVNFDGANVMLYIDGNQTAANLTTRSPEGTNVALPDNSSSLPVRIGANSFKLDDRFFDGNVADIKIWNRALSPREIADEYNKNKQEFSNISILFNASNSNIQEKDSSYKTKSPTLAEPLLKPELVFRGLEFPTNMAFLGPNDILVLEKNKGTVQRIVNGVKLGEPLLDVNVATLAERGMLGIAIAKSHSSVNDSSFAPKTYVFLYFTESGGMKDGDDSKNGIKPLGNRLYRYELIDNKLVNPKLLLDLPALPGPSHNGGEIIIGPDQNVYLTIGDISSEKAQLKDLSSGSKVQNVKEGIVSDMSSGIIIISQQSGVINGSRILDGDPLNKYYAYGIRNSYGMDFDPVTGKLWDTENGNWDDDEINLVELGFNSGWRVIQGMASGEEDLSDLVDFDGRGRYSDPEFTWSTTVSPTALKFFNSTEYGKQYENDMFVGDFNNGNIYHFDLNENRTGLILSGLLSDKVANSTKELQDTIIGKDFGAITELSLGPDGYLYVLSLYQGGDDCRITDEECIPYDSGIQGAIFRLIPTIGNK